MRIALSNQKDDLLAFARVLDEKLAKIAHKLEIPHSWVREVCLLRKKPMNTNLYWQKWNQLYQQLSDKFLTLKQAVEEAIAFLVKEKYFSFSIKNRDTEKIEIQNHFIERSRDKE